MGTLMNQGVNERSRNESGLTSAASMQPMSLRPARSAGEFEVVEVNLHEMPADLEVEEAKAVEAGTRGFMLGEDASGLCVFVEGDDDFASLAGAFGV